MGPRPGRTKTAVDRVGRGKERQVNARFLAMTNHYVFEPTFCNPASGWDEPLSAIGPRTMARARSRRTCRMPGRVFGCPHCVFGPNFPDLAALNAWLEQRCMELWREIPHGGLPGRRCLHRREGV